MNDSVIRRAVRRVSFTFRKVCISFSFLLVVCLLVNLNSNVALLQSMQKTYIDFYLNNLIKLSVTLSTMVTNPVAFELFFMID